MTDTANHDVQYQRAKNLLDEGKKMPAWALNALVDHAATKMKDASGGNVGIHPHWRHKTKGGVYELMPPEARFVIDELNVTVKVCYKLVETFAGNKTIAPWSRDVDGFIERFEPVVKVESWEKL